MRQDGTNQLSHAKVGQLLPGLLHDLHPVQLQDQGSSRCGLEGWGDRTGGLKVGWWKSWSLSVEMEYQRRAVIWWKRLLRTQSEVGGKLSVRRDIPCASRLFSRCKCLSWLNALQQQPRATVPVPFTALCQVPQTPYQDNCTNTSAFICRHLRQNLIPYVQFTAYVFHLSSTLLCSDEYVLGTCFLPKRNSKHLVAC